MEYVIVVTFGGPSGASEGMGALGRLHDEGRLEVKAAAVVQRAADGAFRIGEEAEHLGLVGSVAGGVIGALVGALAGPVGLLVGGTAGVAIGSVADTKEADTADALVTTIAMQLPLGSTAVVAEVDEAAPAFLDSVMSALGGVVVRHSRVEVEAELAAATEAERDG
jgi:uncharacterized membrane protein